MLFLLSYMTSVLALDQMGNGDPPHKKKKKNMAVRMGNGDPPHKKKKKKKKKETRPEKTQQRGEDPDGSGDS